MGLRHPLWARAWERQGWRIQGAGLFVWGHLDNLQVSHGRNWACHFPTCQTGALGPGMVVQDLAIWGGHGVAPSPQPCLLGNCRQGLALCISQPCPPVSPDPK